MPYIFCGYNSIVAEKIAFVNLDTGGGARVCNSEFMNRNNRQRVHIEHDLVGYIPLDELLKAEQA